MYDNYKTRPLLPQVPLTVSPFISLPSAVTLPYTFRSIPTSLPPSLVVDSGDTEKPKYIVSSSGHAAHPSDIIASCTALQEHIKKSTDEAARVIREWEEGIRGRELAEKRRVAPGWLDRDEKILEPTKIGHAPKTEPSLIDRQGSEDRSNVTVPVMSPTREGEELDRAFGSFNMK